MFSVAVPVDSPFMPSGTDPLSRSLNIFSNQTISSLPVCRECREFPRREETSSALAFYFLKLSEDVVGLDAPCVVRGVSEGRAGDGDT